MENIKEGNLAIGKFMDINEKHIDGEFFGYYNKKGLRVAHSSDDLQYHSSWDWLMPVVEKIESLHYVSRITGDVLEQTWFCDFCDVANHEVGCFTSYESKIHAVYNAVIDFIQWYTNNTTI